MKRLLTAAAAVVAALGLSLFGAPTMAAEDLNYMSAPVKLTAAQPQPKVYSMKEIADAVRASDVTADVKTMADAVAGYVMYLTGRKSEVFPSRCCSGAFYLSNDVVAKHNYTPANYAKASLAEQAKVWAARVNEIAQRPQVAAAITQAKAAGVSAGAVIMSCYEQGMSCVEKKAKPDLHGWTFDVKMFDALHAHLAAHGATIDSARAFFSDYRA